MTTWTASYPDAGPPAKLPAATAPLLLRRAEQALNADRLEEAAALYRQLLAANVSPGFQLFRLGVIANRQKDFDAAWELHHRALAADPELAAKLTPPTVPHHRIISRPRYDTEEVRLCPVCGSTGQAPLMVVNCLPVNHYHPCFDPVRRWVQCQACAHGFANPRPSAPALTEAFRDPPPAHLLDWSYERLLAGADIVHELWQRRPGGAFLDIGVGNGALAGVARDYGYRVCGLDLHPAYAEHVARLGVEFVQGDICACDFAGRQFDVIALGDVIEHVAEPRQALARVVAVLRPGALMWLSTPNHEGVWTRSLGDGDPMWLEGEHLQYFCRRSLTRLLAEQGLQVVDYRLSKRFVGCMEVLIERPGSAG